MALWCDVTYGKRLVRKVPQPPQNETFVGEEHQTKIACEQHADLAYAFCPHVLAFSSATGRVSEATLQPFSQ